MEEKEIIKGEKSFVSVVSVWILFTIIGLFIAICIHNSYARGQGDYFTAKIYAFFTLLPFFILNIMAYYYLYATDIVVTNMRVYGKATFGKRVDLPLDSISAVGLSFWQGIDVGTSSGRIHFKNILNNNEVLTEISKLINNRQSTIKEPKNNVSIPEELKKYKELADSGVITQEEFKTKKKQLLDL